MTEYIGITRPLKVIDGTSANLDAKYGPYNSIDHAINEIPISIRRVGLTVGIIFLEGSAETVKEYWWKGGIEDEDLELKLDSAAPTKTSQLENDADFQDGNQVAASLQVQKNILDAVDLSLQGQISTINQKDDIQDNQIQNIITSYIDNKGYFASLASLQTSYPSPEAGDTAYVADALSSTGYYIYNVVNGVWTASTVEAPPVSVPISNYAEHGYTDTPKTLKEVDDSVSQLAGDAFDLFSIIGSYISKNTGEVVISSTRKRTDYLPISLSNDLIVTGYDGSDLEEDGVALVYFYDHQRNPLGRFDSGQYGRVNRVLISKDYITNNYPSAAYVIASATTGQDDAIIIGIRANAIKSDYDALIGDIELENLLLNNNIIGSRQEVSFNATSGLPTVITYYNNLDQMVRQDIITYSDVEITEVRVITIVNPNVSITLTTDLETYKTEVTWN